MTSYSPDAQVEWEATVSTAFTSDVLWKLDAYRASVFLLHQAKADIRTLRMLGVGRSVTDQLLKAAGSVSGNLSEGYGRATPADLRRFIGYALGSCRECLSWYFAQSEEDLPAPTIEDRLQLLARTRSMLLGLSRSVREKSPPSRRRAP